MSFLLSQPGKRACHFMFDCSSKSGGVPLYNPSVLPTRHLRGSGRVPDRMRSNTSNYRLSTARATTSITVPKKILMWGMLLLEQEKVSCSLEGGQRGSVHVTQQI